MRDPLFITAVLSLLVAAGEILGRTRWGRHMGSALWVIVLTAVVANLGLIPPYSDEIAVYHGIFAYIAPLAIFLLVLQVNLRRIWQAGLPMIGMFLLGSLGTTLGVLCGLWAVDGREAFGVFYNALGGMFVATYTGGSVNYNAVALHYEVVKEGALYAGAAAVDSAMTTVWMAVTVAVPRWLKRKEGLQEVAVETEVEAHDAELVNVTDIGLVATLACLCLWFSEWLGPQTGVPSILILATLALLLAQSERIQQLKGPKVLGWLAVMFFLAVIGALCDLQALAQIGELGTQLILFVAITLLVHGLVMFGIGAWLKVDPVLTAVASQANIGGSTSALALARSLGQEKWVLPAVLAGALGNALGTYLGFATAALL